MNRETDFPRVLELGGLALRMELSGENFQALVMVMPDDDQAVSITFDLAELEELTGMFQAARAELRKMKTDREAKAIAARAFVMQVGGIEAARAALAAAEAAS